MIRHSVRRDQVREKTDAPSCKSFRSSGIRCDGAERFLVMAALLIVMDLAAVSGVSAQGFNLYNNRNHPYLEWQVAETDHFRIVYPAHLAGIEASAAAVAEEVYEKLVVNFGVRFERKIRIYLSDEDEIVNGFASPLGGGYTNIWVNLNDHAEMLTGQEKWLRKVIAHELAHIFHFEAVRTPLGMINYLVGDPTPLFWAEGVAQYQTESWNSERGDRWLRLAIFDGRPGYDESPWLYNNRLLYASGHSQVRYFAETYGDSTLAGLLAHRDKVAGLLERHDFRSAFRNTTGDSYEEFYETWRKHMNVHYHTLASQMERVDSLSAEPERLPGRYYFDLAWSPDRSRIAVLAVPSLQLPGRRLYMVENDSVRTATVVAEGAIRNGVDWSPQGDRVVYARRVRGENGSLLNDLFLLDPDTGREERLTFSRRMTSPVFSPDGESIAAVVNNGGTGNILLLDLQSGRERYLTGYEGDVQLIHLTWNHPRNELLFQRFDRDGHRHLVLLDLQSGRERILDPGEGRIDNRRPLVSPDGQRVAFTSLRDEVPNLFMTDLQSDTTWRVTRLFTGADAYDWIADEDGGRGKLAVRASEQKRSEAIYLVSADRIWSGPEPVSPAAYSDWRTHRPTAEIPTRINPDPNLITDRYRYRSWSNLTHGVSLALPWYAGGRNYGVAGFTGWVEPLGKHAVTAGASVLPARFSRSGGFVSYLNNQFYPSILFSLYRMPATARFYGRDFLVENRTGADLSVRWPIDRLEGPNRRSWFGTRLRYFDTNPYRFRDQTFSPLLPVADSGQELSLRVSWTIRKLTPFYRNRIHPMEGYGLRLSMTGSERLLGGERSHFTADADGYLLVPGPGAHRIFLHGRLQAQLGDPFHQDKIGFSRYDNITLHLPLEWDFLNSVERERVRGYRGFLTGRRVAFGSVEYRMPLLPSLRTTVLGFFHLSTTSLVLFADAGIVGDATLSDEPDPERERLGMGGELKNLLRIGPIDIAHSLGVAQPHYGLFKEEIDLYYRVRATLPF